MAQHGWEVTGIDFVPSAIQAARKKVQAANVAPRLIQGDVTRLNDLGVGGNVSRAIDCECARVRTTDQATAFVGSRFTSMRYDLAGV